MQRLISSETGAAAVAIVDRTANVDQAAQEILKSRIAFSGRSPYAPSYILVNEFVETEFLDKLRRYASRQYRSSIKKVDSSDKTHTAQCVTKEDIPALADEIVLEAPGFQLIKISNRYDGSPIIPKIAYTDNGNPFLGTSFGNLSTKSQGLGRESY